MKEGDGCHRELATASTVVAEDAPVQSCQRVLHASPAAAMAVPGVVADDAVTAKDWDAKGWDTAVPTVGE